MFFISIPRRRNSCDSLRHLLSLEDGYRPAKRLRMPSDEELEELVMTSSKMRRTDKCSDKFEIHLDVTHFRPEDITIKVIGSDLMVEGKHEERLDEYGFVSRHFTRRYELPNDVDCDRMLSSLSSDGKLSIEAPKKQTHKKERFIPITFEDKTQPTIEVTDHKKRDNDTVDGDKATDGA